MQDPYSGAPANPSPYSGPAGPSFQTTGGGGGGGLDWRQLWQTLLEKGWVVILLTLTGLFLAWGYLARSPKLYQSHIVLEVQTQEATLVDVGNGTSGGPRPGGGMFGLAGQEALHTIEQNLRNRALLVRVLKSENLLGADGARALLSTPKAPYTGGPLPEETMANVLGGTLNATIRRGTRLIDIFVTHADPALARRLADAIGREFIRMNIERKQDFYQQSTTVLLQEAERLKANLQKSERAVSDYKANTPNALTLGGSDTSVGGGGSSTGAGRSSAGARLEELSSKLSATKSERMRLESDMAQIEAAASRGGATALLAFPVIANSPIVSERRRELAGVQGLVAQLSQRYKDKHPKMINARVALDGAQAALTQAVLAEPALLRSALGQAKANEEGLQAATKEGERAALDLNRASIGYAELARQADTDRVLYENIIGQIKRTGLAMEANRSDAVSIVENASQPGGPVSPQPTKVILAGVLGGLFSGLALVGLLAALDRTVKTVEQAESVFGLPVLAAVPEVEGRERRRQRKEARPATAGDGAAAVAAAAPEGPVAEAFRSLRAALALLGPEDERRVVLMTSALPGEGKSFASANLALALAQQGQRVLLIDGDLRRPTQGRLFFGGADGDNGGPQGVIDYLLAGTGAGSPNGANGHHQAGSPVRPPAANAGGPDIMALTRPIPVPGPNNHGRGGLWLLPAGRRAPNPAELLSSSAGQSGVTRMIADGLQHFDRIVVDSAPVLAVSDTLLLLPYTHTVLVVVHARKTARAALARALTLLAQAATGAGARAAVANPGAPAPAAAAGLILNRLPRRRGLGYYYYYGQEYSYGQLETREVTKRGTTPASAPAGDGNGQGHLTGTR